jgi:hypothetical protein
MTPNSFLQAEHQLEGVDRVEPQAFGPNSGVSLPIFSTAAASLSRVASNVGFSWLTSSTARQIPPVTLMTSP